MVRELRASEHVDVSEDLGRQKASAIVLQGCKGRQLTSSSAPRPEALPLVCRNRAAKRSVSTPKNETALPGARKTAEGSACGLEASREQTYSLLGGT